MHACVEDFTPPLLKCRDKLANTYLSQVDERAWPPVWSETNLKNLALIENNSDDNRATWRDSVQEALEKIIDKKKDIIYSSELFEDSEHKIKFHIHTSNLYLFQGRPGCGKTTLMSMLSREWGNGKLLNTKLLFLVSLRQFSTQEVRNMTTIIQQACPSLSERNLRDLLSFIEEEDGKNVVFAFDGLDEYTAQQENDIIFKLIECKRLQNAIVIVTSRPAACTNIRAIATREIEVLGFLQKQIFEYMQGYFKSKKKAQQLIFHLDQHPNLMHMCYLPLHCSMFAFLLKEGTILPQTETEFYEHYTISTLLRSIRKRHNKVVNLSTYSQLPPQDKMLFDKVCELAFNGVVATEPNYVFTRAEITSIFGDDMNRTGNDESTLGLIVIDRYFMRNGLDETYTFLHRTFQEYLAAVHIAQMREPLQIKMVKDHRHNKHLSVVWKFLCGMKADTMDVFKILFQAKPEPDDLLFQMQCAYESQHVQPCKLAVTSLNQDIDISFCDINFSPMDFITFNYVITTANNHLGRDKRQIISLHCEQCKLSAPAAEALLNQIGEHPFGLELSK